MQATLPRLPATGPAGHAPLRLAFVIATLGAGGAERVVALLSAELAAAGHEVHCIVFTAPDQAAYHLPARVRIHALDLLRRSRGPLDATLANLRRVGRLRRALREIAPQAVLAFLPEASALSMLAAFNQRLPVIVSERNASTEETRPLPWRALRWLTYRTASAVVFQTERARRLVSVQPRRRFVVIPNPVHTAGSFNADPEARVIVAAGRLVPQKGFDLLLAAFAQIAPQHPGWSLRIWGEGPERGRLERQARQLGIMARVDLAGTSRAPGAWLEGGAIFVLPSRYEGFPNALCEAMAAGYAVVAADCRFGPREIVSDGIDGRLVPAVDGAALATALTTLMDDPARRRELGAAARASIRRFDLKEVAGRWESLLAAVIPGCSP